MGEDCLRIGIRSIMARMNLRGVVMCLCFVLLAAGAAGGQRRMLIEDREGTLGDLNGMRRFYVIAQNRGESAAIVRQMNGRQGLRHMRHGTTAQFHVTYECTRWAGAPPDGPSTAELRVTIPLPDSVITHVWAKKESTATCKDTAARRLLVNEFLKDFGRISRGK